MSKEDWGGNNGSALIGMILVTVVMVAWHYVGKLIPKEKPVVMSSEQANNLRQGDDRLVKVHGVVVDVNYSMGEITMRGDDGAELMIWYDHPYQVRGAGLGKHVAVQGRMTPDGLRIGDDAVHGLAGAGRLQLAHVRDGVATWSDTYGTSWVSAPTVPNGLHEVLLVDGERQAVLPEPRPSVDDYPGE